MTCRQFIEFLLEYLSGELAPEQKRIFDEHVGVCTACRAYLHNYEDTVALGRSALNMDDEPLPADVPEDLVTAILAARTKSGTAD